MNAAESGGTANVNVLRQRFLEESLSPTTSRQRREHGESIIIIGAGAFGCSLALELVTHYRDKCDSTMHGDNRRYVSVDVFDKWPVPSRDAASTDTTKIIRADYTEPIYAKIAGEAIQLWKTNLFTGVFHQTGTIGAK